MHPVKNVGQPCAGEPYIHGSTSATGGNQASRPIRAAQAPPAFPTATSVLAVLLLSRGSGRLPDTHEMPATDDLEERR
jgi:hypothetical protein